MYIYSEKTNKKYDSVDACLEAEAEFDRAEAEKKEKKERLANERKDRAKEVEDAFKKANDLLDKFVDDYGSFHCTLTSDNSLNPYKLLDWLF